MLEEHFRIAIYRSIEPPEKMFGYCLELSRMGGPEETEEKAVREVLNMSCCYLEDCLEQEFGPLDPCAEEVNISLALGIDKPYSEVRREIRGKNPYTAVFHIYDQTSKESPFEKMLKQELNVEPK